jgi:CBS domain-containing protein
MSRYRDDRDDYYYGRERRRAGDYYEEDRYEAPREGSYGRARRDEDDYGRGRTYDRPPSGGARARAFYDDDYGRRDYYDEDRTVLARPRRRYDETDDRTEEHYDRREGRSLLDEGRDFFRRAFGADRDRGRAPRRRGEGPSRSHVRCRDIMTRDVTVATRETLLEEVARMMRDEDTGVIPVIDRAPNLTDLAESGRTDVNRVEANVAGSSGKLIGLITDRDIVVRSLADGKDPRVVRAEEIMTTDIHSAQPNDRVVDAVRKMGDKQVRRIPIVDRDGTLRGIISMADVALETEDDRELAEALEEISSGSTFWNRVFG